MVERFLRLAQHPRLPYLLALLAFLLSLPAVTTGFLLDDFHHLHTLRGGSFPGGPRGIWDLYRFADGGEGLREGIDRGMFPWWTNPQLKLAFFRPLSSLWRAADHAVWGESPIACHLEACLMYGGLAYVAARLYGRLVGGAAAGFAAFGFALDDGHGQAFTWISNRYALLSGVLSLLAFHAHVRARSGELPRAVAPLLFALALCAGEPSLAVLGYLVGYALFVDPQGRRPGMIALLPFVGVALLWAINYRLMGYGAAGSDFYIDPASSPLRYLAKLPERLPLLALAQVIGPAPEFVPNLAPHQELLVGLIAAVIASALYWALLRLTRASAMARALAVGSLLAALPACATYPDSRLLLLPGFGVFGVIGIAIETVWRAKIRPGSATRAAIVVLVVVHGVISPLLLPVKGPAFSSLLGGFASEGSRSIPQGAGTGTDRVVLLGGPDALFISYMFLERMLEPGPAMETGRMLTEQDGGTMTVERVGSDTLLIENPAGEMNAPFSRVMRERPLEQGEVIFAGPQRIEIKNVNPQGVPTAIHFTLGAPLEELHLLVFQGRRFVEVPTLALGERRSFEMQRLMDVLR